MTYALARAAFENLSQALRNRPDLYADVLGSLDRLLTRYNTQIYENRFIVGGVTERIIAATFVAIGQPADNSGVVVTRTDIRVGETNLSVKGSFRPGTSSIRLVNVMGDSKNASWREATIFVISERGIGYADPELLPRATKRAKDAITLKSRSLYDLWEKQPNLLLPMNIPYSQDDRNRSDVASRIVADEILRYSRILRPFDPRLATQ